MITNLDKIHFQFNFEKDTNSDLIILDFKTKISLLGYKIKKSVNINYINSYQIYNKSNEHILNINFNLKIKKSFNLLRATNNALYESQDDLRTLFIIFKSSSYIFNFFLNRIEIALNSNKNLLRKYKQLLRTNQLDIKKGYHAFNIQPETTIEYPNIYIGETNDCTHYIQNKKNTKSFRIENKMEQLNTVDKGYIVPYLLSKGFEYKKHINRLEISVHSLDSFRVKDIKRWYNSDDEFISNEDYKMMVNYIKTTKEEVTIFNDKKLNYEMMLLDYSKVRVDKEYLDFDLELMFDYDYLTTLYFHYSTNILDINKLVKMKYNIKYMKSKRREPLYKKNNDNSLLESDFLSFEDLFLSHYDNDLELALYELNRVADRRNLMQTDNYKDSLF